MAHPTANPSHLSSKRAEEALQKARREWENIFQAIGHPTLILDKNQRLIHANSAAVKVTGKPVKALLGLKCYEIFHNSDHPPAGCPFEKMLKTGRLETATMLVEALDRMFLVSCTPMLDSLGRLEKVIHIATDITEQERIKKALEESEAKYRDLVVNARDIIFSIDLEGNFVDVNEAFLVQGGWTRKEIIGCNFMSVLHPEDMQIALNALQKGKQGERGNKGNRVGAFHRPWHCGAAWRAY